MDSERLTYDRTWKNRNNFQVCFTQKNAGILPKNIFDKSMVAQFAFQLKSQTAK